MSNNITVIKGIMVFYLIISVLGALILFFQ